MTKYLKVKLDPKKSTLDNEIAEFLEQSKLRLGKSAATCLREAFYIYFKSSEGALCRMLINKNQDSQEAIPPDTETIDVDNMATPNTKASTQAKSQNGPSEALKNLVESISLFKKG